MTEGAATLLRLMRGGRVGKAGQEPARLKGRKSWCLRKPWLLPSLLTLTSVSKPHLGPCMIRGFFMGWGWDGVCAWGGGRYGCVWVTDTNFNSQENGVPAAGMKASSAQETGLLVALLSMEEAHCGYSGNCLFCLVLVLWRQGLTEPQLCSQSWRLNSPFFPLPPPRCHNHRHELPDFVNRNLLVQAGRILNFKPTHFSSFTSEVHP